jgi:hypothetical protein
MGWRGSSNRLTTHAAAAQRPDWHGRLDGDAPVQGDGTVDGHAYRTNVEGSEQP